MTETEKAKECYVQLEKNDLNGDVTVPAALFDISTVSVQCSVKTPKP